VFAQGAAAVKISFSETIPALATPSGVSGYYKILARHSGKGVVVQSASTANAANILQYTYGGTATNDEWAITGNGGTNQQFQIVSVP
jgi:hypothetical protein